uniref:Radical SAM protein n=1 Tax=candidate division WOR-3 bacterium TaxID=2052148 RepID=A0A7C3N624_UNCW3
MKIFFYSMGCKLNQSLTKRYIGEFVEKGWEVCSEPSNADIIVLSSCIVTETSQKQFKNVLERMVRKYPEKRFQVVGCYDKDSLEKEVEYIQQDRIFQLKNSFINRTRVEIPIQTGCNSFCSYCIVPYFRGDEKSREIKSIIEEVEGLIKKNVKEIVLTGVHIGRYNSEGKNLIDLIEIISQKEIERIRLSSLDINEIDEKDIEKLAKIKKVVPFFHLSLQHISEKVLKMMKRKYNKEMIKNLLFSFEENFFKPMLGCDVIVGFPFENDLDFLEMVDFYKNSNISHFHIFPYSRRKETLAYYFEKNKDSKISIEEKMRIMREVHKERKEKFLKSLKGEKESIIFEGLKDGKIKGKGERYFDGYLEYDDKFKKGDIIKVKVLDYVDGKVICEERNL